MYKLHNKSYKRVTIKQYRDNTIVWYGMVTIPDLSCYNNIS